MEHYCCKQRNRRRRPRDRDSRLEGGDRASGQHTERPRSLTHAHATVDHLHENLNPHHSERSLRHRHPRGGGLAATAPTGHLHAPSRADSATPADRHRATESAALSAPSSTGGHFLGELLAFGNILFFHRTVWATEGRSEPAVSPRASPAASGASAAPLLTNPGAATLSTASGNREQLCGPRPSRPVEEAVCYCGCTLEGLLRLSVLCRPGCGCGCGCGWCCW